MKTQYHNDRNTIENWNWKKYQINNDIKLSKSNEGVKPQIQEGLSGQSVLNT